jgi:5'-nucleotidase/UDP-sugar diphosphatase
MKPKSGLHLHQVIHSFIDNNIIKKYIISEFDDERVGVIGVNVRDKTLYESYPDEGTTLLDERETVMAAVKVLEDLGINKIVVLSHGGYPMDQYYLSDIPGVDVIIGGDTHTLLGDPEDLRFIGQPEGPYPTIMLSEAAGTVCIYQAWEYGHGLGFANIVFDEDGNVIECGGKLKFPYDDTNFSHPLMDEHVVMMNQLLEESGVLIPTAPDNATQAALDIWSVDLEEIVSIAIADVPNDICHERELGAGYSSICGVEETMIQGGGVANLVAQGWMKEIQNIDITILNAGTCRQDIKGGGKSFDVVVIAAQ